MADGEIRALKQIDETLGKILAQVRALPKKFDEVVETLKSQTEAITEAIYDNIRAQAEFRLMERMADVEGIRSQVKAERELIDSETEELDARLDKLGERYEERHAELNERARERIRDLGSHIFELDEEQFEAGIEDRYLSLVPTSWDRLQEHNNETREERSARLREAYTEADDSVESFIQRREALLDRIDEQRTEAVSVSDAETLDIPFWEVEVEVDGVRETRIVAPSEVTVSDGDWFGVSLDSFEGLEDPTSRVQRTSATGTTSRSVSAAEVRASLSPYDRPALFGSLSFADTVAESMDGGVTVEVETGGESQ